MMEALEVHRSGELRDTPMNNHLTALMDVANRRGLDALREALRQRYQGEIA